MTFNGSYTVTPTTPGLGGVAQYNVSMVTQGTVILSGTASFPTADTMIFTMGSQNLPGAGFVPAGNMTELTAGL